MNPVNTALVAGLLIIGGKWAKNQSPTIDNAIGIAGIALGLAFLSQVSDPMSRSFGALIVLSLAVVYLPSIVTATGLKGK